MAKFLTTLKERLNKVPLNDVPGPDNKLEPGEVVLGVITDPDLQRLYTLHRQYGEETGALALESQAGHGTVP